MIKFGRGEYLYLWDGLFDSGANGESYLTLLMPRPFTVNLDHRPPKPLPHLHFSLVFRFLQSSVLMYTMVPVSLPVYHQPKSKVSVTQLHEDVQQEKERKLAILGHQHCISYLEAKKRVKRQLKTIAVTYRIVGLSFNGRGWKIFLDPKPFFLF